MAVPSSLLDQGEYQVIALSSNDAAATGTAADFTIQLSETLKFAGGSERWAVAIRDAFYRAPDGSSVYVSSNIALPRIDGSQNTQTLVRIPPAPAGPAFWKELGRELWLPLAQELVRTLEVSFTDDTGAPIAVQAGDISSITLLIRRVGHY